MAKFFKKVIFIVCAISFNLQTTSLLVQDSHGWGYLTRIENSSQFPVVLSFEKASFGPFEIEAGGNLGDEIPTDSEVVGDILAPINAVIKTRIRRNGIDLTKGQDSRIDKKPTIVGAAIREINAFDADQLLYLQPMYSKAIAWMAQQDLINAQNPKLDMTISFLAYVRDSGQAQVVFSTADQVSADWSWKIVLDASENGQAQILLQENGIPQVVAKVDNLNVPAARILPGKMNRFWISIKGSQLIIGSGKNGENPFLIWQDPTTNKQIKRLGFSSAENPLTIARIANMSGLQLQLPAEPLAQMNLRAQALPEVPLRESGAGALVWQSTADFALRLQTGQDAAQYIAMSSVNKNLSISYYKNGLAETAQEFSFDGPNSKLWFFVSGQQLVVGQGEVGKNTQIVACIKHNFLAKVNNVVWQKNPPESLQLFATGKLSTITWVGSDSKKPLFSGTVKIYQPYKYQFDQEGASIVGRDLIYNKTYILAKTPQQAAFYPFVLTIDYEGNPELKSYNKSVNIAKFFLNYAAMGLRIGEAVAYNIANEAAVDTRLELNADLAVVKETTTFALAGGLQGAVAAFFEAEADAGFRENSAFGLTEVIDQELGSKDTEKKTKDYSDQIKLLLLKANNLELSKVLKPTKDLGFIKDFKLSKKKDFDYAIQLYSDAVGFIQDLNVLRGAQRQQMVDGVIALAKTLPLLYKDVKAVYNKVIGLILSILNHQFFFNFNNLEHRQLLFKLNDALQILSARLFFKNGRDKIILPKAQTRLLWAGKTFDLKASVFFKAKASSGLIVQFLPVKNALFADQLGLNSWVDAGLQVYQVLIGAERNKIAMVKVSEQGAPVAQIALDPSLAPSGIKFKPYWIDLNAGKIALGQGDWGINKILEWQDPYPQKKLFLVSIAGLDGSVEIQDFRLGPVVAELNSTIIDGATQDEVLRQQQLDQEAKNAVVVDVNADPSTDLALQESPFDIKNTLEQDPLKNNELLLAQNQYLYNPLEFGDLTWDAYDRYDAEDRVYQDYYAQKAQEAPVIDEDAERKRTKAEQRSKDAAQDRQSRGATQKMQAQGLHGIAGEVKQIIPKNAWSEIKSAVSVIKEVSRKLFSKSSTAEDDLDKSLANSESGREKADAGVDRKLRISKQGLSSDDASATRVAEASATQEEARNIERRQSLSNDPEAAPKEPSRVYRQPDASFLNAKTKYEFGGERIGELGRVTKEVQDFVLRPAFVRAPRPVDVERPVVDQVRPADVDESARQRPIIGDVVRPVIDSDLEANVGDQPARGATAQNPAPVRPVADQDSSLVDQPARDVVAVTPEPARQVGDRPVRDAEVVTPEPERFMDAHESSPELKAAAEEFAQMQPRFTDKELSAVDGSLETRISFDAAKARVGSRKEAQQSYQIYHNALNNLERARDKLQKDNVDEQSLTPQHRDELRRLQAEVSAAENDFVARQNLATRILYDPAGYSFSSPERRKEALDKQKKLVAVEEKLKTDPENEELKKEASDLRQEVEPEPKNKKIIKSRRKMAELKDSDGENSDAYKKAQKDEQRFMRYKDQDVGKIIDFEDSDIPQNRERQKELLDKQRSEKLSLDEKSELEDLTKKLAESKDKIEEYDQLMADYHGSLKDKITKGKVAKKIAQFGILPLLLGGVSNYGSQPDLDEQDLTKFSEEEAKKKLEALGGSNLLDQH